MKIRYSVSKNKEGLWVLWKEVETVHAISIRGVYSSPSKSECYKYKKESRYLLMKKFNLSEVKKTVLKIKKDLMYNENVVVKFIVIDQEYIEVLIAINEIDYTVKRIDFVGLFDLISLKDWIELEIDRELKSMLNSYIYRK